MTCVIFLLFTRAFLSRVCQVNVINSSFRSRGYEATRNPNPHRRYALRRKQKQAPPNALRSPSRFPIYSQNVPNIYKPLQLIQMYKSWVNRLSQNNLFIRLLIQILQQHCPQSRSTPRHQGHNTLRLFQIRPYTIHMIAQLYGKGMYVIVFLNILPHC